jgi:hypothetical protein
MVSKEIGASSAKTRQSADFGRDGPAETKSLMLPKMVGPEGLEPPTKAL